MGRSRIKLISILLVFSLIATFPGCTNKNGKNTKNCLEIAETYLDAAVSLNSKKLKKLNIKKSDIEDLQTAAANIFITTVMDKASYEIDEESAKENGGKISFKATITIPEYKDSAFESNAKLEDFIDLISKQKKKNYEKVEIKLSFKKVDGEYELTNSGVVYDELYAPMLEVFEDMEIQAKPTPTPVPTPTPSPTPTPTTYATPTPIPDDYYVTDVRNIEYGQGEIVINLYSISSEVPNSIGDFMDQHPDMAEKYTVKCGYCNNDYQAYEIWLNQSLASAEAPDLYVAESDYILPYVTGDLASYALPYADLIDDFDAKLEYAELAPYSVEIGTNLDGDVVALGYQSTAGAMIYRRSIAKDVFGTDDPDEIEKIFGGGTQKWDKFMEAADKLKDKGYATVSGLPDIWSVFETSAQTPWIVDNTLNIDPSRQEYVDIAKKLIEGGYTNDTWSWGTAWYADMKDEGERRVFCWFGPAWLYNWVIGANVYGSSVDGDYAICQSPVGFWWGGASVFCNKSVLGTEKAEFCAAFLEWLTLETSEIGFQYSWANGISPITAGCPDAVTSGKVMDISDGSCDLLGEQDPFMVLVEAASQTTAKGVCVWDSEINPVFDDLVSLYAHGYYTEDEMWEEFYLTIEEYGFDV